MKKSIENSKMVVATLAKEGKFYALYQRCQNCGKDFTENVPFAYPLSTARDHGRSIRRIEGLQGLNFKVFKVFFMVENEKNSVFYDEFIDLY